MSTAKVTVTKEAGMYTGRSLERFFVAIDGGMAVEFEYKTGFEHEGRTYEFRTAPSGGLEIIHPETGKRIRLGKTGGTVDLSTWTKMPKKAR